MVAGTTQEAIVRFYRSWVFVPGDSRCRIHPVQPVSNSVIPDRQAPAMHPFRFLLPCLFCVAAGDALFAQPPQVTSNAPIDFNRGIRPILSNRCLACHGPDSGQREAGLRLDDEASATKPLQSGQTAVVPGQPDASELMRRITTTDPDIRMPPPEFGAPLTVAEQDLLKHWISQGAPFAKHWSYEPPVRPDVPPAATASANWPKNPIDNFLLQQLTLRHLQPSPQAEPRTLVRRLYLDLIGLPPTLEEARDWAARLQPESGDPNAVAVFHEEVWQQLIEHLLSQPQFGEHCDGLKKGACGKDHSTGAVECISGDADAGDFAVFSFEGFDGFLAERERGLQFDAVFHFELVGLFVRLCAGAVHGRAFTGVEHPEMNAGMINDTAHFSAQRIDFTDNLSLGHTAYGRVAAHLRNRVAVHGK